MIPPPAPALPLLGQAARAAATLPRPLVERLRAAAERAAAAEWAATWRPRVPDLHLLHGTLRAEGHDVAWAAQRTGHAALWLLAPDGAAALAEAVLAPGAPDLAGLAFGVDLRRAALETRPDPVLLALAGRAAGLPLPPEGRDGLAEAETRLGMADGLYRIASDYGGVWVTRWDHYELDPVVDLRSGPQDTELRARAIAVILFAWARAHPSWPLPIGAPA
jgi:hypothetical protein